jgi:hypothetical protein
VTCENIWLGKPQCYGLGVIDFGGFLGHDRQIFGYTSWMGYQPQEDATIIVLVNLYQGPTALSLPTNSRR